MSIITAYMRKDSPRGQEVSLSFFYLKKIIYADIYIFFFNGVGGVGGGECYQMRRHNGAGANSKSVIRSRTAIVVVITVLVQEEELCCDCVV